MELAYLIGLMVLGLFLWLTERVSLANLVLLLGGIFYFLVWGFDGADQHKVGPSVSEQVRGNQVSFRTKAQEESSSKFAPIVN
ncbi:hypothetical protein [Pseudomonas veronii]|uniref:hypothetical protein n=1 Tax=Pseudomonas veronii TaxID=76761 RepID=UPI00190075A5|nr:hypothetical protein [Pseudomonas veronii]